MKIPYIEAKDSETNQIVRGFYFEFPQTTYCFTEDYEREPKVKLIPCVMSHRMTDWGLPNEPTICKPIDKGTLKLIGYIDTDNDYYIPLKYVKEHEQDVEEKGVLIRLSCKVGDTVWYIDDDDDKYPQEFKITKVEIKDDYVLYFGDEKEDDGTIGIIEDDFGKTIFLTKEQAEQALAEMKEA